MKDAIEWFGHAGEDRTWTTVTFRPPLKTKAGENFQNMMSACGRVIIVVGPDSAVIYRRREDGDYELASEINL